MTAAAPPESIKAIVLQASLEISWTIDETIAIPFRELRGACPCANCVNELTGERKFFPADAKSDIAPAKLELTGNYAVRIHWNDGHHTGLFTWDYLRKICDEMTPAP